MGCCDDNVLYNFISPVTGRVLSDYKYVLIGNRQGIAVPSSALIDLRIDFINLLKRYNTLVMGDIIIGHPNKQLPNAQVLSALENGYLYNTDGIVSTNGFIPIEHLPDLPYHNIWIGDPDNRPVPQQRVDLLNLPSFRTLNVTNNFGLLNLYTGQFLDITNPTEIAQPTTTMRINMCNMPNLTVGKMLIGVKQILPPTITFSPTPPFINVTGPLNWDASGAISDAGGVPNEIGLNPNEIFIGSDDPTKLGQIVTTNMLPIGLLPNLTNTRIWRGDLSNRPVESDSLTILEGDVSTLQGEVTTLQGEVGTLQGEMIVVQGELSLINTTLYAPGVGLVTVVAGLVTSVAAIDVTLYTPVTGLVSVVAGLTATVAGLVVSVADLETRTLDQIPLAAADVNLNNHKIINLDDPVDPQDAVNYQTLLAHSGTGVTSLTGTPNEITVSASTGAVTLSLPGEVNLSSSITAGFVFAGGDTIATVNPNGSLAIRPNGTGDIQMVYGTGAGNVGIGTSTPGYKLDVDGTIRTDRLIGNGNLPTVTLAGATTVGTGATYSIIGSELGGRFILNTGTGISATGTIATFTLTSPMPSSNFSVIFTWALSRTITYYTRSTSSNSFALVSTILANSTTYDWNYMIVGY